MNLTGKTVGLLRELEGICADMQNVLNDELLALKQKYIESLEFTFNAHPDHGILFFDLHSCEFYLLPRFEKELKNPLKAVKLHDFYTSLLDMVRPDLRDFILRLHCEVMKLFSSHSRNAQLQSFRLDYLSVMQHKNGEYMAYHHRMTVSMNDAKGQPWLLMIHTTRCPENELREINIFQNFAINLHGIIDKAGYLGLNINTLLTKKELEIFDNYKCMNKKDVAELLHISEATVKTHLVRIYTKLNLKSLKELALIHRYLR